MILKNKEFKEHSSGLFVASDGEIFVPKNGGRYKEHFTYGSCDRYGYLQVMLSRRNHKIHRLVAECWIPNPDNLPTVDHLNRGKTDNRVENLRWADHSLQQYNRVVPKNNANSKKVLQLTLDGELVREWSSTRECERNGFKNSAVSRCCNGKLPHYKKFIWKYKNEEDLNIFLIYF